MTESARTPWWTGGTLLARLETIPFDRRDAAEGRLSFAGAARHPPRALVPKGFAGRIASGSIAVGDKDRRPALRRDLARGRHRRRRSLRDRGGRARERRRSGSRTDRREPAAISSRGRATSRPSPTISSRPRLDGERAAHERARICWSDDAHRPAPDRAVHGTDPATRAAARARSR